MHELPTGVTVTGTGEATAPPDLMTVEIGVSVLAGSVAEATSEVARLAEATLDALKEAGVESADLRTSNYSVAAEHDWTDNTRRLVGYRATNTVRAKVRDLDRAGSIIDAATAAGGDAAQVNQLSLTIEDPTPLRVEAREKAWADASAKAAQLCELSGRALGRAVAISDSHTATGFPPQRMRLEMAAADTSTPIEVGTTTVTATVQARFEFAD